ncbi:hypothetical protein G9A89_006640 [Geosiphon pyriformis]|nr:hypothetical protein G9A89_006640 [Geosiphon pyriformis]
MKAGAAVFFEDINSGLGVSVSGLVSFTLTELQAIALALEYVNWIKVKSHLGILNNECANVLAKDATLSAWCLPHLVNKRFLKTGSATVSGNSRHFLSVAVQKCLYDKCYASMVCLFCGDIEVSDHIFSCPFNAAGCAQLFVAHVLAWEIHSGLVQSSSCVFQLLSTCIADAAVNTALCKGFVFGGWYQESLSAFMEKNGLISCDGSIPVPVSSFSIVFSPGMIRLLDIADAISIGFGFHKPCLFFSDICDIVSIYIGA